MVTGIVCQLWLLLLSFSGDFLDSSTTQTQEVVEKKNNRKTSQDSLIYYAQRFNQLNSQVRDGKKKKTEAQKEVSFLLRQLRRLYLKQVPASPVFTKPVFPVKGYNAKAIGGTHGEGYKPRGYSYYDGNKHKAHPAHDIFISDKNQDMLEDKTKQPVTVQSMSEGVIIATEPTWEASSLLRGGVYVWVYNPRDELLYYYAHNQKLLVSPGDIVKPGTELGTMGRSGLNAFKQRSPTHLHLMALQVTPSAELPPVDLYPVLRLFSSKHP